MKAILSLFALLLMADSAHAEEMKDYRARTIYFLLTNRFNPTSPTVPMWIRNIPMPPIP